MELPTQATLPEMPPPPMEAKISNGKPVRHLGLLVAENGLDFPAVELPNIEQNTVPTVFRRNGLESGSKLDLPVFLRKPIV
jgi:hypothetical protein